MTPFGKPGEKNHEPNVFFLTSYPDKYLSFVIHLTSPNSSFFATIFATKIKGCGYSAEPVPLNNS